MFYKILAQQFRRSPQGQASRMQGLSIFLLVTMEGDVMMVFVLVIVVLVAKLKLERFVGIGIGKPTVSE